MWFPNIKQEHQFLNEKGFSLTEIMIAGGMLGVLALVSVQLTKNSSDVQYKGSVDAEIKTFKSSFSSMIYNPAHCNANFMNAPAVNQLYKCDDPSASGACRSVGTRTVVYAVNNANWQSTGFSNRVRITSITRSTNAVPAAVTALSPATITVNLETRPSSNIANIKSETVVFNTAIVMAGNAVSGCPKSVNTTNLY